jgi:G6PDH family F420-dependent oxidoreductase
MVQLGIFLSSEEHDATTLVRTAEAAEAAGFEAASISDHYHPWLTEQGQSPFVWSVLGAVAAVTERMTVTTGVTCPTMRIHPAVVAHATATTAQLLDGRFRFGIGSGEALNEHVTGARWPAADVRLEMLAEAMEVIRRLWSGETVDHRGRHYTVENARLWTLPEHPPPVLMSAFGPRSVELAARIAEGYYGAWPAEGLLGQYRDHGGRGPAVGELKVCYDTSLDRAVALAHERWRHELVPGQASQDLPTTTHFDQAGEAVTPDMAADHFVCGPDPEDHLAAIQAFVDAGFDEVHVLQIGPDQQAMIDFYAREILPAVA